MKRRKAYDVKSFLNKNKSRSSFISFTVTRSSLGTLISFVSAILFMVFACREVITPKTIDFLLRAGVSNALPFLSSQDRHYLMKDFTVEDTRILAGSISSLFGTEQEEKLHPVPKKKEPEVNIKTTQNASEGIEIKNETEYSVDTRAILSERVSTGTDNPKVLIVHTHGSESYTSSKAYTYEQTGNYRTQNTNYNMIRIGEEIAVRLKQKGIEVIHDKTINDYPSYNDSYNKQKK